MYSKDIATTAFCAAYRRPSKCNSLRSGTTRVARSPENLPNEAPREGAFGRLENVVAGVPDQAPAGLEQPLLQPHRGPALDGAFFFAVTIESLYTAVNNERAR
jgi:hypothetical protein